MLEVGDKAPKFSLESDSGERVKLEDFSDQTLVLYFYPRDSTPGCTREAQAFTRVAPALAKLGARVVGVSKDSIASHCRFKEKFSLKIPLLSDPELEVHKAYGAFGEKTMYGKKMTGVLRTTVIVRGGKVVRVFPRVRVDGHEEAVLDAVRELAGARPTAARAESAAPKTTSRRAAGTTRPRAKKA